MTNPIDPEQVVDASGELESTDVPGRRVYGRPRMEVLGDVRALTLGGSPGTGDSPNAATQKVFGT